MDPVLPRFALIFCMNIVLLFEGFGNKVLRKVFVSKIDETSAGRRIPQNKKPHKFCIIVVIVVVVIIIIIIYFPSIDPYRITKSKQIWKAEFRENKE